MENDCDGFKVVELDALKTISPENVFYQSTAFEADPQSERTSEKSENEELSGASLSISTASSSDVEEHRHLSQSLTSLSLHDCYSSFCSTCSESDFSCSTLEGDSSYDSSFTTDMESSSWREEYSDDDGHYNLIQPPLSGDSLEFWPISGSDDDSNNSGFDELETSLRKGCKQQPASQEDILKQSEEEEQEFCVQCHSWPEVEDCRGGPGREAR